MHQDILSLEAETFFMTTNYNFYVNDANFKKASITRGTLNVRNYILQRKYFHKWSSNIKNTIKMNGMQKTKINEFIATLKNHQKDLYFDVETKSENTIPLKPIENFKSRYKVQHTIIDLQKKKIKEQDKIINELKSGIIREDFLKSVEHNKSVIREIFGNCTEKILCEAPLLKPVEERETIMINAQKAPKIVQDMEERAIQRKKYRAEILERKRIKEEEQQKVLKEMMEKKKLLEEEEIQTNLEILNEQRRKEFQLQKLRLQNRQKIEQKILMARNFYNKALIKQCFKKLFNFYKESKENVFLAVTVFVHKEKFRLFKAWVGYVEAKYSIKNNIADGHFSFKSLKRSMTTWKEFKLECIRSIHVAEDFYDLRITINTFVHWHRYVCKRIMIEHGKNKIAVKHNNRRMIFHYFHQWRYLPAIIKFEKSKEETKRKWRDKVWEILPDFQPPEPS